MAPMSHAPARRRRTAVGLLPALLLLAVAGCGGDDDDDSSSDTAERTTTTLAPMPADFDWWNPAGELPLGDGWVLHACEGEDGTLCFEHPGGRSGILELFRFDAPADFNINAHAARFVEDFRNDRTLGCGAEYRVEPEPIEALDLPDGPARRYGFHGGAQGSVDTERTIQWAGLRGTSLVIVTLSGYDPGSCVAALDEATLEEQAAVLDGVHALILAAGLPKPEGAPPTTTTTAAVAPG
jgi:hypothetical protein